MTMPLSGRVYWNINGARIAIGPVDADVGIHRLWLHRNFRLRAAGAITLGAE
ncbi:MAG: hypothetical protein GKR97_00295 [Rhizobiaceae bacterium]|nr:hypothetical protein [Rhizobiaceae bacterium]